MIAAILAEVRDEIDRLWRGLVGPDRRRCCAFLRRAASRRWKDKQHFLGAAERALKPRAVDWERLLALLQMIASILLPLIVKAEHQPR